MNQSSRGKKKKKKQTTHENSEYRSFISGQMPHLHIPEPTPAEIEEWKKELQDLEEEECQLVEELRQVSQERLQLLERRKLAMAEQRRLSQMELDFYRRCNEYVQAQALFQEECDSKAEKKRGFKRELERLSKLSSRRDAFQFGTKDCFGTINGLRIGKDPSIRVDWDEVNAGLGHCLFLLWSLAKISGFRFSSYTLIPLGSNSKLIPTFGNGMTLEL